MPKEVSIDSFPAIPETPDINDRKFCDTRSLRSSRDLLWELFSTALCNNADEHFVGRQAGDWAMLYHQLDALMQAAW